MFYYNSPDYRYERVLLALVVKLGNERDEFAKAFGSDCVTVRNRERDRQTLIDALETVNDWYNNISC